MVFIPRDHIRSLISRVTEANLRGVCDEIHYHIRPEGDREIIHTIAVSILEEAAGPGHTLVPQYHLAGVCWTIHDLCRTPGHGAGAFLSISLPQSLDELCQKEFVDANQKLENGEDEEGISSIVLDLVVLIGELYKLGLVEDEVMKGVYLDSLHCGYKGSEVKAEALCLLLELLAIRWDIDPTSRNIDVEKYVLSLLDYLERYDPHSTLAEEILVDPCLIIVWHRPRANSLQGCRYSIWYTSASATTTLITPLWFKLFPPRVNSHTPAIGFFFCGYPGRRRTTPGLFLP